ncbi:MAG: hypothetical protein HYS38_03365 [Acidobacteria bacterium]|nr:hypothetical protein [Acidobacteriota bacterium]
MKPWKPIAAGGGIAALALASFALMHRSDSTVSADNAKAVPEKSFFSRLTAPLRKEMVAVPAGTRIPIRLEHAISTESNNSGDTFTATLDKPLLVDEKLLAPAGSKVMGLLTDVTDAGRGEGRASLTMVARKLVLDGKEYDLTTQPLTFVARSTKKKDAAVIAGGTALGAAIGAIAGGGKGAAIGAGVGGGSGTGYVLATKGEPVAYGPEARFTFTLSDPLELPVHKKSG